MKKKSYEGAIIDGHCHLASTHFIPRGFYQGLVDNVAAKLAASGVPTRPSRLLEMYLSQSQDHNADELVAEMDKAGIDKAVILLPDFTHVFESELTISEMFDKHHEVLQRHPDHFVVFAGVDPRWGDDGIALFEKGVKEYNFKGLKIYPPCGYSPSDKSLYPYYEICREHKLPVLLHIGPTSPTLSFEYSVPGLIDRAAMDFPEVNFILAHGSVHHFNECAALCAYRANIYLDTGAFLGSLNPQGWQAQLRDMFKMNINHKIIFGTDWPVFRMSGGQRKIIESLRDVDGPLQNTSTLQANWIMNGNIRRLVDFGD
ncbi:MAG: amidohydrolase family protein [Algicola sp.]|nr:amidohydrolase family protein [Algicola sp.]